MEANRYGQICYGVLYKPQYCARYFMIRSVSLKEIWEVLVRGPNSVWCSAGKHLIITKPLSTQGYKWVPANCRDISMKYRKLRCASFLSRKMIILLDEITVHCRLLPSTSHQFYLRKRPLPIYTPQWRQSPVE